MHPALRTNSEGVAYGPFLDFLKAVFKACGITASAEAQAKAVKEKTSSPLDLMGLWRKLRKKLELTPFETSLSFRASLLTAKTAVRMSP